jgi:hypothetical protein
VSRPAAVRATIVRNQSPQVKNGTVAVPQNRQAVGSIAKLGWDPEKDSITFVLRSSPAGQLILKPDGSFVYEAPSGVDVDTFSFVANDGNSDSNEGELRIQITDAATPSSSSSSTATTAPSSGSDSSSSPSTTAPPTTATTRKSSTTTTTGGESTTSTTATSGTADSNGKTSGKSSGKSKKQSNSSNNRGKPTKSKSKR